MSTRSSKERKALTPSLSNFQKKVPSPFLPILLFRIALDGRFVNLSYRDLERVCQTFFCAFNQISSVLVTVWLFEMDGSGHGGLSKNRKRRVCGKNFADKGQRRRAARFTRLWRRRRRPGFHRHLYPHFSLASSPVALRPPHPWPKAIHCGVASSLFCF